MPADATAAPTPDEHARLLDMVIGGATAQAVYVAAKLGIADVLAEGPATAEDIAKRVGSHPEATYRLLRALTTRSIFAEEPGRRFRLTPMAQALRSDVPDSVRPIVLVAGHPVTWQHWGELTYSVATGNSAFEKLHGMPVFDYLAKDPDYAALFNESMTFSSAIEIPAILDAYDFSRFGTIVEVGGGQGRLLAAILQNTPNARGVLFDLDSVVAGAPSVLTEAGVGDRSTVRGGSFFDSVPSGGDAYILKHIIHDWPEDKALDILGNVRAATGPDATLLVMDMVLPEDGSPHFGKLVDLDVLVAFGGRHRTEAEYADLLARAGFRLTGVTPTAGSPSIIEAVPV
ncbi:methyltransferase [Saccharomonospora cyanea]|uniref:O-methyltransferase n=1 Tax=Saccharomonospora cyanea NA-134 TaxID=882082 RepID=H5XCS8_9PSEU|nr:methyltransferase [Saccharomonospora cyanea]EHR62322.1 O-methyltransferase [Saccharomonospora cyanea NA-134]